MVVAVSVRGTVTVLSDVTACTWVGMATTSLECTVVVGDRIVFTGSRTVFSRGACRTVFALTLWVIVIVLTTGLAEPGLLPSVLPSV